jgi:hypothetical protein
MAINTGDLNSLYKVAYAKGIIDELPDASVLIDMIPFVPSELQNGKQYEQPVVLAAEQGFTYSLDSQNAYDLNDSIGMAMQSAIVPGADIVLDSTVGYNQAARASHSATSFKSVMSTKFENMIKSTKKRLEIAMLYGQGSIGQTTAGSYSAVGATVALPISAASWATGIWTGSENARVKFSVASSGFLPSGVADTAAFIVTNVDVDARTITFTEVVSGDATDLAAAASAALNVHFFGSVTLAASVTAPVYSEMAGLKKIITNTGSLFGIDAGVYDLWRGNVGSTSGQLTMAKVLSFVSKAVQRGLDVDATVLVNPSTWADLASNLAALRRFDGSYSSKKLDNGAKQLEYYSQNGSLKIVSYNIVKEGDCFIFPEDKVMRIGARDLGLNDPTRPQDEIFFTIPGKAGVGIRAYTNQAIFLESPAQAVYVSGIVNSLA